MAMVCIPSQLVKTFPNGEGPSHLPLYGLWLAFLFSVLKSIKVFFTKQVSVSLNHLCISFKAGFFYKPLWRVYMVTLKYYLQKYLDRQLVNYLGNGFSNSFDLGMNKNPPPMPSLWKFPIGASPPWHNTKTSWQRHKNTFWQHCLFTSKHCSKVRGWE